VTIEELIAQADKELNYPFEKIIERYWPAADAITDVVCSGVLVAEDLLRGGENGQEKKNLVNTALFSMFNKLPVPTWAKPFVRPLFQASMSGFIDLVVRWLNKKWPDGWLKHVSTNGGNSDETT